MGDQDTKALLQDEAPVTLNEESGEKSAVSTKETSETNGKGEEISESANKKQKPLPQHAPAADQIIPEKNNETIGPTSCIKSTPTSDVQAGDKDPSSNEGISPEDTNQPNKIPPSGDGKQIEPSTNMPCADHSNKTEVTIQEVATRKAPVTLNEESGEKSAVSTEETRETNVKGEEISESANEKQKPLPQDAPAAEQIIPEKNNETIGPTSCIKSTPTSDVQAGDKDVKVDQIQNSSRKTNEDKNDTEDDHSNKTEVATRDEAPVTSNEEQSAVSTEETSETNVKDHKRRNIWIAIALVAVAILLQQLLQPREPLQKTDLRQIDIFHKEMEKMKVQFPSQREELWKRSRIHLQRHFQIKQPTEPISIILTAGVRAESTLHCLAQSIASALSSALNASALHLDGASKFGEDSDKVKSDIDSQLQKAFEGGKPIAVIHRFEELPPASTLIFYRYCDHENAAFKKTFLIFTVLLGEEEEIQAKIRLSEVEEMVTDHLQKKFLSHGHPTAFDKMDIDKYGGLWSRISHLILPVATEKRIEKTEQC